LFSELKLANPELKSFLHVLDGLKLPALPKPQESTISYSHPLKEEKSTMVKPRRSSMPSSTRFYQVPLCQFQFLLVLTQVLKIYKEPLMLTSKPSLLLSPPVMILLKVRLEIESVTVVVTCMIMVTF
jgi:hypothetical protein